MTYEENQAYANDGFICDDEDEEDYRYDEADRDEVSEEVSVPTGDLATTVNEAGELATIVNEDDESVGDVIPKIIDCAIKPILPFIDEYKERIIFEACCGSGNIVSFLKNNGFKNIIPRDLYTMPEKHNFLDPLVEIPYYDILITNPPFCSKYDFLQKAYDSKKPF
eukprot:gene18140-36928_t